MRKAVQFQCFPYGSPHPSTQVSRSCPLRVAHHMQQARHSDPDSLALQLQPRETEPIEVLVSKSKQSLLLGQLGASICVIPWV